MAHYVSARNVGTPNTPHEVLNLRRQNIELLKTMGQPVLHMHMFGLQDLEDGHFTYSVGTTYDYDIDVMRCPSCWDDTYQSDRADCEVCHGVTIVSTEVEYTRWITDQGRVVDYDPGTGVNAPYYRGYGPPTLTWVTEPDAAEDFFKLSQYGVLTHIKNARAQAPWTPDMNDNDLLVEVDLARNGHDIIYAGDRYQLKMSNPQTMRGFGARYRQKKFLVGQEFEMVLVPRPNILYDVPTSYESAQRFYDNDIVFASFDAEAEMYSDSEDAGTIDGVAESSADEQHIGIDSILWTPGSDTITINGDGLLGMGNTLFLMAGPLDILMLNQDGFYFNPPYEPATWSWTDTQVVMTDPRLTDPAFAASGLHNLKLTSIDFRSSQFDNYDNGTILRRAYLDGLPVNVTSTGHATSGFTMTGSDLTWANKLVIQTNTTPITVWTGINGAGPLANNLNLPQAPFLELLWEDNIVRVRKSAWVGRVLNGWTMYDANGRAIGTGTFGGMVV